MTKRRHRPNNGSRSTYNRHQKTSQRSGSRVMLFMGGVMVVLLLGAGLIFAFTRRLDNGVLTNSASSIPTTSLTPTVTFTPTATLFPIVDADLSRRQMLAALQRWTDVQTVEIGCVAGVCNQKIQLSLTLLTPELLAHTVTQEFSGQPLDPSLVDERIYNLEQRLHMDDRLVFVLTVTPDDQKLPVYNEITLGSLLEKLVLRNSEGDRVTPIATDSVFDVPISLVNGRSYKSYVSFPNQNQAGQYFLDTGLSLNLQLPLSEVVKPQNSYVSWTLDLLQSPDPPALTPTPTTDPNQPTPTPSPWADPDVYIAILELIVELASQQGP